MPIDARLNQDLSEDRSGGMVAASDIGVLRRCVAAVAILIPLAGPSLSAQFNLPVPVVVDAQRVAREDLQKLFIRDFLGAAVARTERIASMQVKLSDSGADAELADSAKAFCGRRDAATTPEHAACIAAVSKDSLVGRFGTSTRAERPLSTRLIGTPVPGFFTSRADVSDYLRSSGGGTGFTIASQFAANIGENDAYVVSSIVRGQVGRALFSADQASVVTTSDETDAAARETDESDRANVLRAINNGGTLVGRLTLPMYARSGSTMSSAGGVSVALGLLGAVTGDAPRRDGAGTVSGEYSMAIPVRDLSGNGSVVADLLVGLRAGYTYSGIPILVAGGAHDLSYAQLAVGLRQNNALTVSVLASFVNKGFQDYVPRITVNFTARR
ncbi:MAG: hypothetical protein IT355_16385 [Gemmatimonadaceae bacterium]|nr:hypothetical protein [Gemmatimonadaceae bacterium]